MAQRFLRNVFASSLAMITISALTGCSDVKKHSFDPLIHIRINAIDQRAKFENTIFSFVAKQNLNISNANFPRDDRTVINLEIDLDKSKNTFVLINNFRKQEEFDLVCYSHEDAAKWMPFCDAIVRFARDRMGSDRVEIVSKK